MPMTHSERSQLVASQVEEHLRQAVAPAEASWATLRDFFMQSIDGVYLNDEDGEVLVTIDREELQDIPLNKWAKLAKAKLWEAKAARPASEVEENDE